jgi:splicing factor 3B subunit 3
LPNRIVSFHAQGDRVVISDAQESVSFARYLFQENKIMVFADDPKPRHVSRSLMLDFNTVVVADKFGTVSVQRIPKKIVEELDDDVMGNRLLYERPYLQGAPHKVRRT